MFITTRTGVGSLKKNLQPEDYASIAFSAAALKQEIVASTNFKTLMAWGELPGYTVDVLLKVAICPEEQPLESACINLSLDKTDLPNEPEDEDDDVPY